jgi:hypothetical protein
MNKVTFAILEDLEKEVADIKSKQSNIEVVWELQELKKAIDIRINLILKEING